MVTSLFNKVFKKSATKHIKKTMKNSYSIFNNSLPKLLNTLMILCILYVIFYLPLNTMTSTNNYFEKLEMYYGTINKFKAPIIVGSVLILCSLTTVMYTLLHSKKRNTFLNVGYILIYITIMIVVLFYLPKHCGLGTCVYKSVTEKDLTNAKNINFFAIGDIQNSHAVDENTGKWVFRKQATDEYINAINEVNEVFKNKKIPDTFNLDDLNTNEKNLFEEIIKDDIVGLVSGGDCVHGGRDGRTGDTNNVGAYEYMFGNNPEDGSKINIPSYECLGNHDYDTSSDYFREKKSHRVSKPYDIGTKEPTVEMQLRRNKKRKYVVNSDKYGNYSCDWGDLHIIFLNVWPSRFELHSGKPEGSLEFLESDLKVHGGKKWMLMTHCIPDFNRWTQTYHGNRVLEEFGVIFDQYKDTCLGTLSGHFHLEKGDYSVKDTGLKRHVLPGPAGHMAEVREIELPLFSFNKATQENTLFIITVTITEYGNTYKVTTNTL
jgi:hypothetical protein